MRIRNITDYIGYPLMSIDNVWTKLWILSNTGRKIGPPMYFDNEQIFAMFNTYEKVEPPLEEEWTMEETFIPIAKNPAWIKYLLKKGITDSNKIIEISEKLQEEIEKKKNLEKIKKKIGFEDLVRKTISDIELKYDGYIKTRKASVKFKEI